MARLFLREDELYARWQAETLSPLAGIRRSLGTAQ
jgi:hypothetical protein